MQIVVTAENLRKMRYHEDAISRLAVAAEALKTVGNVKRSEEVSRICDEVIKDYADFVAQGLQAPALSMERR